MKKRVLFKILGTILLIIVFCVGQSHIRQCFGIDSRIWFFVLIACCYGMYCMFKYIFKCELQKISQYCENHTFAQIQSDILKMGNNRIPRILDSFPYMIIACIAEIGSIIGVLYKTIFFGDFVTRKAAFSILIVMLTIAFITNIIHAIFEEKPQNVPMQLICRAMLWGFPLLMNIMSYSIHVCSVK